MTTSDSEPDLDAHVAPPVTPETSLTDWSMVYRAADLDGVDHQDAWDNLVRRYWPAIYAYVRKSGRNVHEASDLTQGFVCDVVIGRRLLESANPSRGRFRTLLLTSLRNYLVEQHRYATRRKRAPDGQPPIPVDIDDAVSADLVESATPEAAFAEQWTAQLVHCVIERVRADCEAESLGTHWQVFEARIVRPMLHGEAPVAYTALVEQFDLQDAAQAQNMMITIKRRFARLLHQEVGQTVHDPAEIEEELFALLRPEERPR